MSRNHLLYVIGTVILLGTYGRAQASCTATGPATTTNVLAGPPTITCNLTVNCCSKSCCTLNCCVEDTDECSESKTTEYSATGGAQFELYVVNVTLGASWATTQITEKKKTLDCKTCTEGTGWVGYQSQPVNYSQKFNCPAPTTLTGTITTNTATSGTTPGNCP
jgi:hypothetical protein